MSDNNISHKEQYQNVTITSVTKMYGNNIYPHVNPIRQDTKQVV